MDAKQAKLDIVSIFNDYRNLTATDRSDITQLASGKIYELWVLSKLIQEIAARGYTLAFTGTRLKFKGAPGYLKLSDPHFTINHPSLARDKYRVFVDVEFTTRSASLPSPYGSDRSDHYEADIIVTASKAQRPIPKETAIVVECKAHANLRKGVIREVLGTRRELSVVVKKHVFCVLPDMSSGSPQYRKIPADPPVELRLVTTDPKATNYSNGPRHYGIDIIIECP